MSGPFLLVPMPVTNATISSSTTAEPAAGETLWNAAANYVAGQEAILTTTHRVYTNQIAGIHATSPELALTGATPRWLDTRPTNKWAAFDGQISTQSAIVTPLTYVLLPGMFNALAFYGLDGSTITVSIKDAPGGTVVYTYTGNLQQPPSDYYDHYFGQIRPLTKLLLRNLTPYANPEVTVTITSGVGVTVKVGMIAMGNLRSLISVDGTGGTQYGAKAKPITYSYISTDVFGTTKIVRRTKATNLDIQAEVPIEDADRALASIQEVLDVPCAVIATDAANYSGLNAFGLVSGDISYAGPKHALINVTVQGFI